MKPKSDKRARVLHRYVRESDGAVMVEVVPHQAINARLAMAFGIVTRDEVERAEAA